MKNGFLQWVLGIVAGLVLLAVSGGILFDRDVAADVARQGQKINGIEQQIETYRSNQRAVGDFNRVDALQEFRYRDEAIRKLEERVDRLERNSH